MEVAEVGLGPSHCFVLIKESYSLRTAGVVSGGRRGVSKRKVFGSACLRRGVKEIDRQRQGQWLCDEARQTLRCAVPST